MNFNQSKLNNRRSRTAATVTTVVLAGMLVGTQVLASGAEFNIFPIAYDGRANHDYPLLDARNFSDNGAFSTSQSDHDNGVSADPGEIVEFVIYYHNGAADADENIAHNVRIKTTLPSGLSDTHTVSAQISADDATTVSSSTKGGNMTVHVSGSEDQRLEYVPGSTRWFPDQSSTSQTLPDGIVSSGVLLGDIRGCWDFSGFVKFRAKISENETQDEDGRLEIDKTVSNRSVSTSFGSSVDAEPSDIVEFRIKVTARDADVENVIIRDILPSGLTFRSGTLEIDNASRSGSQGLFGSGIEYGTLSENDTVTVSFEADVASNSFFDSNSHTLTNTANARGRDTGTVQDSAQVRVEGETETTSFRLSKSAFNQTKGLAAQSVLADGGDIINYTLTYENTGNSTISNVVIEDDLHDVLQLADIINEGGGTLSGSTLRYPSISVSAGISISKTFQVRVRAVSSGQGDLTMTNFYGNQVDVQIRPISVGPKIPPKSGPEDWVVPIFAALFTGSLYLRKRLSVVKANQTI